MPIYEYACASCGAKEERIQSVGAPEVHDCPSCSAPAGMTRLVSRTAFVLSGGGWYASGYAEGSEAKAAATAAPASEKVPEGKSCATGCGCHPAPAAPPPASLPGPGNT